MTTVPPVPVRPSGDEPAVRPRRLGPVAFLLLVFACSRALVYAAGARFDARTLEHYWQFLDPELLRTELLESLLHLHSQPPLYNAAVGAILKLSPIDVEVSLHAFYVLLGLVQMLALYAVLVRLGIRPWRSAGVAAALAVLPATLLYEHWLFYEYPTATLLVLSALALHRLVRHPSLGSSTAFFALAAALVYTRSTFQLPWLVLAAALLVVLRRDLARPVLAGAAVPALAVVALVLKNVVLFGVPSTSSWLGMNLAQVTHSEVPLAERRELVARGELSAVSSVEPFRPPAEYVGIVDLPDPTGIPALDRLEKSSESPNMNHLLLVDVSRLYLHDAWRMVRLRPGAYARTVIRGGKLYFRPSSDFVPRNGDVIEPYTTIVDRTLLLRVGIGEIAWGLVLAHVLALLYGLDRTLRLLRRRLDPTPERVTIAYVWLTLSYVTAVVTFGQIAENNRIRFFLDPLVAILLAAAARELGPRLTRSRASAGTLPATTRTP
jgi:hypothetical protein